MYISISVMITCKLPFYCLDILHIKMTSSFVTGFMETDPNRTLEVTR